MRTIQGRLLAAARNASRHRRGSIMVEYALSFSLVLTVFSGIWSFGYTFYAYNILESAVRNGARYGGLAAYDGGTGAGASYKSRIKNMVVYGNTNPPTGAKPVVDGLTTDKVVVTPLLDGAGVPIRVSVAINGFTVPDGLSSIFRGFTLNGKPSCTFEYNGRYTVP